MDNDNVQSADFETLNGHGRNDDEVIQRAFRNLLTKDKQRRRSCKNNNVQEIQMTAEHHYHNHNST